MKVVVAEIISCTQFDLVLNLPLSVVPGSAHVPVRLPRWLDDKTIGQVKPAAAEGTSAMFLMSNAGDSQ